jgi:hypothetical protein
MFFFYILSYLQKDGKPSIFFERVKKDQESVAWVAGSCGTQMWLLCDKLMTQIRAKLK